MSEPNPNAPHGFKDDGVTPNAPFGYLRDGVTPRKGNRGARPGPRSGSRNRTRPGVKVTSRTDRQRLDSLVSLADMLLVTPLASLSASPQIAARFGEKHATALAGDAVILSHFSQPLGEGLIALSQTKPGVLAWMDTVEDKAPYLLLANVGLQMTKAIIENHLHPNEKLASSGGLMLQMKLSEMAQAVEAEAAAMGIYPDTEPTVRIPEEAAA